MSTKISLAYGRQQVENAKDGTPRWEMYHVWLETSERGDPIYMELVVEPPHIHVDGCTATVRLDRRAFVALLKELRTEDIWAFLERWGKQ